MHTQNAFKARKLEKVKGLLYLGNKSLISTANLENSSFIF